MKKIVIIGTLHGKITLAHELEEMLASIAPDKIFVELSQEELKRPREKSIRDEMFVAYDWAVKQRVPVECFDVENDIFKNGITDFRTALNKETEKMKSLLQKYSWKDLNKKEPWQQPELLKIDREITTTYFDKQKLSKRNAILCANIKNSLIDGVNVVVTGVGHLDYMHEVFPDARIPLREPQLLEERR